MNQTTPNKVAVDFTQIPQFRKKLSTFLKLQTKYSYYVWDINKNRIEE